MDSRASPKPDPESDRALVGLVDRNGHEVGRIRIVDRTGRRTVRTLEPADAIERGEERVQLTEGRSYEFQLEGVRDPLRLEPSSVVQPSQIRRDTGRIETGVATGLLTLRLVDERSGLDVAAAGLEVRTSKIDYHAHYRRMLADISETSCALLLDIRAPSQTRLATSRRDPASLHEQFVILRSLLDRDELQDSISRILDLPHRRWRTDAVESDPRKAFRATRTLVTQIVSRSQRLRLPDEHPLANKFRGYGFAEPSLPSHLTLERQGDTLDTPENRFVKFVLGEWESFLVEIATRLSGDQTPTAARVRREVEFSRKAVTGWLSHAMFSEVGRLTVLPLASPVLQRRAGYREVLLTWLRFRAGTALIWSAGSDVFGGGNKDVALLYEYWVFFELRGIVKDVFELDPPVAVGLFEDTGDGLDLRLRSGKSLDFSGRYASGSRPLRIRFSYNRTFAHARPMAGAKMNYPAAGSWTKPMRPDYTLSLWPAEFSEAEAERQELMTHVHFDAKYRVDDLASLFGQEAGAEDEELEEEKRAFRTNQVAKRADLLKMHAYRDAIRRTEGAYVIYPGSAPVESQEWWAFHEILPGLGAFSLRPGMTETSHESLRQFIEDVANFVCDETTRLEQETYHTFRIQEDSGRYRESTVLPERDARNRTLRKRPSRET